LEGGGEVDFVDLGAELEEFIAVGDGGEGGLAGDLAPALHHEGFFVEGWIIDDEFEEEAVGLRLGERVGALLLDRVLRGHDEERAREGVGVAADGDLALLHGFEEGGLDLGGGAVDFVGEDEIGEDGAAVGSEVTVLGGEDHGADDIAGEEVGGELDAFELDAEGGAEGFDEEGFGETRHALEEDVAVGEEGDEQALDDGILADDGFADFVAEFLGPSGTGDHDGRWEERDGVGVFNHGLLGWARITEVLPTKHTKRHERGGGINDGRIGVG